MQAQVAHLAGQTWPTFFNVGALPQSVDSIGPAGTIFERQSPAAGMTLGGEYILASKDLENVQLSLADDEGELRRLQFSARYAF
ncbi:hypothetical protein [Microbulbifer magnicolonia]|uniref:hypothetical protein n=1 Tax=Microbulbifer magnicolonia TaxID=3109744 RepID=UPI002B418219|nr:hypothetical protein [Microbulbifer sp. GG15]